MQYFLEQYNLAEPSVKAWVEIDFDSAFKEAQHLDTTTEPEVESPLRGIPFGIKDIINVDGFRNQMGSPTRKNYFPGNDARCVAPLRSAKAIPLGKTSTAEFAVHSLVTLNTRNPLNETLQPGTSSAGSAAAVSSGMIPWALATQTAGSITRPASYCGVIGFKPSFGAIARTGILKTADTLDTVGFISRHIEDLEPLLETTIQNGRDYPLAPAKKLHQISTKHVQFTTFSKNKFFLNSYDAQALQSYQTLIEKISQSLDGAVPEFLPPDSWQSIRENHATLYNWSLAYYLRKEYSAQPHLFSETLEDLVMQGKQISLDSYQKALNKQQAHQVQAASIFRNNLVMLTPATSGYTPKVGDEEKSDLNLVFTYLGLPTISLPYQLPSDPTNLSLLIAGARGSDYMLLRVASYIKELFSNYFGTN